MPIRRRSGRKEPSEGASAGQARGRRLHLALLAVIAAAQAPAVAALATAGLTVPLLVTLPLAGLAAWLLGQWTLVRPALRRQMALQTTETALHHCSDVLNSMVSALPVGVVAMDRNMRVEMWNHAAETILGYSAAEMMGRPAPTTIFMPAAGEEGGAVDVFLRMVTGQLVKGEEVICRRKDGGTVEASFSGAPLMDADERILGAICVFEDIAQRRAIARQLHQAQKMEAVGQLTGGLAHDFNNILGVAIGNLDLLDEELAGQPAAAELSRNALNALLRGAELTRALLAFSRRQPLRPSLVKVGDLLAATVRVLSRILGEQIQVSLQVEPGLWPIVVDAAQLEAAITNLAINARDAMPSGGKLCIEARNLTLDESWASSTGDPVAPGDYVCLSVSDTGGGIPPENLPHVFEPFFTTKPVGQGTGLGLSMVYGFIRQSGGNILIVSEVGTGTSVRLTLPRAPGGVVGGETAVPLPEPLRRGSETVLVVDDNEDVRRMVESQLHSLGYRVITAGHGRAALDILDGDQPVDLLFTDIVMPQGMNGFELAEQALRRRPGLRVLFSSGFPGTSVQPQEGLGSDLHFIGKPYRRQELARMLRDVLDPKGEHA